jgi:hypothetical protein
LRQRRHPDRHQRHQPGAGFPGTKLRALAEAAGMVIDAEGRFVRCDEDGNVLYVLLNQENLRASRPSR